MAARFCLFALLAVVAVVGQGQFAQGSDPGIRDLHGAEKRAFYANLGWSGPYRCSLVGVSRSDQRWAIVSSSFKCGPASGHVQVYKLKRDGHWRYLFYDMENDGCEKFRMPSSVRSDFSPYVC